MHDLEDEIANIELEAARREPMIMTGTGHMAANATITTPFDGFWLEFGSVDLAALMAFNFKYEEGYDEILSITTGLQGDSGISSSVTVIVSEIKKDGKITGLKVMGNWGNSGTMPALKVNIQAVCRIKEVVALE